MFIDVLDRGDLRFPRSLPEFQRMFPDEPACAAYAELYAAKSRPTTSSGLGS